jgi:uncharacterized protein (UPF0332 family)
MSRLSLDLLAQARVLAGREPRRPKEASLRRSISASYYALFHYLIEECARLTVGAAHERAPFRQFAGRAFVHAKMKAACEEFAKTSPKSELLKPFWAGFQVANNLEVRTIAENFIDLQEQRHAADYDLSRRFSRQDANIAADQAQEAIEAWKKLKAQQEKLALLFALSLMLWPGLSGR